MSILMLSVIVSNGNPFLYEGNFALILVTEKDAIPSTY